MFRGVANLNLDAKGRIAVPARYRELLQAQCEGRLIVTVDPDRCLLIYPLPEWEDIERRLIELPSRDPASRAIQRLLMGYATDAGFDAQGRILIPPPLREFAGIERKAVLIGQGRRFELWDEQAWKESCKRWVKESAGHKLTLPESHAQLQY